MQTMSEQAEWVEVVQPCWVCGYEVTIQTREDNPPPKRICHPECAQYDEKPQQQQPRLTESDVARALNLCYSLWPGLSNQQSPEESSLWSRVFRRVSSLEKLFRAIEEAKLKNRYRNQILQDIQQALSARADPAQLEAEPPGVTGWWVECSEHEAPMWIGRRLTCSYPRKRDIPHPDEIFRAMRAEADRAQRLYGGKWEVFRPEENHG